MTPPRCPQCGTAHTAAYLCDGSINYAHHVLASNLAQVRAQAKKAGRDGK